MSYTNQISRKLLVATLLVISIAIISLAIISAPKGNNVTEKPSDFSSDSDSSTNLLLDKKNVENQSDLNDSVEEPKIIHSQPQSLEAANLVNVHGQISDINEKGLSGIQVEISSTVTSATPNKIHATITDDSGSFTISHVPSGSDYRFEVLALGVYAGTVLDQLKVEPNMSPIAVALDTLELVSIDGTIVGTDYSPVPEFELLVRNIGIAYPGNFPAGDIQLATNGDEHFEITGITLSPGEYRNMTLVLDKGSHELSGNVVDSFGQPIEQARIVATSKFSGGHYQSSSYRLKVTDSNGYFSFTNLGDWDRQLVVDATGYQPHTRHYSFQTQTDTLTVQLLANP